VSNTNLYRNTLLPKTVNKSLLGSKKRTAATVTTTTIDTTAWGRIENTTEGLSTYCLSLVQEMLPVNQDNALAISDYILSLKSEINLSDHYRKDVIILLCKFLQGSPVMSLLIFSVQFLILSHISDTFEIEWTIPFITSSLMLRSLREP